MRCGGGTRALGGGGASCLGVGRPWLGAHPSPSARPLRRAAGAHYPLAVGAGGVGVGTRQTTPQRALVSWLCALWGRQGGTGGGGGGVLPGCGASGAGRSPNPDHPSLEACGRGPVPTGCGCGGCERGDRHQPHSARSCELALRAVGAAQGCPGRGGGGGLLPGCGEPGVGRSSTPRPPVFWSVRAGPVTQWLWVRGVWAWGPVFNPRARQLASWLCALWGRHEGALGGRLLPGCGASGVWLSPTPNWPSFGACGRGRLPTSCGCGGYGRGESSPAPQRALLRAGLARCGSGTRVPRRGASCLDVGRPGSGALPPPTARPLGRAAGAHYPLAVGAGVVGAWGPVTNPTARALASWLCAMWWRQGGARGRRLLPVCGASESGRSPTPDLPSFGACGRGPLPTACGCGECGRGDPSPIPQRALL